MRINNDTSLTEFTRQQEKLRHVAWMTVRQQRFYAVEAEDLLQAALLVLVTRVKGGSVIDDGFAFLAGTIRFMIFSQRRRQKRHAKLLSWLSQQMPKGFVEPLVELSPSEVSGLHAAIARLSATDRLVVDDFMKKTTLQATAATIRKSIATVHRQRKRTFATLAGTLQS